jgi:hypothetical protein
MGISNVSNGLRSGVCTSSTRPTAPYEGQVIYETDTDRVLVWNASAWVIPNSPAQNPTGLELITRVSPTPASTISVAGCFSSNYTDYKIIATPIAPASSSDIRIKLVASGTAASISYYMTNIFVGGTSISSNSENNQSSWRGVYCGAGTSGNANIGFYNTLTFDLFGPFATNSTRYEMQSSAWDGSQTNNRSATGFHDQPTSYNGFELSAGSNITATISVYGYRNS